MTDDDALAVTGGSLSGVNRELYEAFRDHGMSEAGALVALRGRGGRGVYDDDADNLRALFRETGLSEAGARTAAEGRWGRARPRTGRDKRGPADRRRSLTAALTTLGEHDHDARTVDALDDAVARLEEAGDTFEEALAAVTRRAARARGDRVPRWARSTTETIRE